MWKVLFETLHNELIYASSVDTNVRQKFWNRFKGTHLRLLDLEGIEGVGPGLEGGGSMPILGV